MRYKQSSREKRDLKQADAGLVSELLSGIANIEFRMTYYRCGRDAVLMNRTLKFSPSDHAVSPLKCMEEGCAGGGYDLAPVIAGLARSRKTSVKGKIICRGTNHAPGHASIAYEVTIRYNKQAS